ncbi:MAG: RNA-binding protein [Gammaproteobacteria bacterium]|nr:MAG: RNA-binding protein [Gammaproteobacteria bacterium]
MTKFNLKGREFITLDNLLKIQGLCDSGGRAKQVIADGQVKVDGTVELRKRCKIKPTQQIEFAGQFIEVVNETINQP